MGKEITGKPGQADTDKTGNKPGDNGSTSTSRTEGRGRGRGTGSTERKPREKGSELSVLKSPKEVEIEVPGSDKKEEKEKSSKGRGRPKGSTAKKKTAASKKKADSTQVKMLLLTVSGIVSSKPNMQPFALTMEEVEQIADPLTAIMSKNDGLSEVAGEYADHIALLLACFTIFVPKYLVWKSMQPKKEEKKGSVQNEATSKRNETRPTQQRSGQANKPVTSNGENLSGDLYSFIPATGGF
jgi:hypothetical protein